MGMELRFVCGNTTLNINDGSSSIWITEYVPKPGGEGAETVAETIKVIFTNASAGRALMNRLNELIGPEGAATRYASTGVGSRVFVELMPMAGEDHWRSEVVPAKPGQAAGRIEWHEDTLSNRRLPAGYAMVNIYITRLNDWEGPEAEVELQNGNASGVKGTGGRVIVNHDDSENGGGADDSDDNWVFIDGDDIDGDIPTPAKIKFTNTTAGVTIEDVFIGQHIYEGSSTPRISHIFEGEAFTGDAATVTNTADAACSGDAYGAITTATYNTEIRAAAVVVTNSDQQQWAGNWYRAFMRLRSAPTAGTYARLKLQKIGVASDYIWQMPQMVLLNATQQLQELALVQLPPDDAPTSLTLTQLNLALYLKLPTSAQLDLDYIAFMPVQGWRAFDQTALGLEENDALFDDGIEDRVYIYDSSATAYRPYSHGRSTPIMLVPGKDQEVRILTRRSNGNSIPADTGNLRIYYRPKRVTL
jgi:hypothetical protein